jgi:hypothetical protein
MPKYSLAYTKFILIVDFVASSASLFWYLLKYSFENLKIIRWVDLAVSPTLLDFDYMLTYSLAYTKLILKVDLAASSASLFWYILKYSFESLLIILWVDLAASSTF